MSNKKEFSIRKSENERTERYWKESSDNAYHENNYIAHCRASQRQIGRRYLIQVCEPLPRTTILVMEVFHIQLLCNRGYECTLKTHEARC
jgi:hypothetical protein